MRRKIEVRKRGTSDPWATASLGPEYVGPSFEWRYVGGVLEYRGRGMFEWAPCEEQQWTVQQAKSISPNAEYRLRPYDDRDAKPVIVTHDRSSVPVWSGACVGCGGRFEMVGSLVAEYQCGVCGARNVPPGLVKQASERAPRMTTRPMTDDELRHEVERQAEAIRRQKVTIARLTAERDEARTERAQRGDELGEAKARITELEAECFRWRRRAEDAERKAKVRQ